MRDLLKAMQPIRKFTSDPKRMTYSALGMEKTMPEWCEYSGLSESTIRARIRRGKTLEEAISYPWQAPKNRNKKKGHPWRSGVKA